MTPVDAVPVPTVKDGRRATVVFGGDDVNLEDLWIKEILLSILLKLRFTHKTVADVEADGLSAEQDEEEVI